MDIQDINNKVLLLQVEGHKMTWALHMSAACIALCLLSTVPPGACDLTKQCGLEPNLQQGICGNRLVQAVKLICNPGRKRRATAPSGGGLKHQWTHQRSTNSNLTHLLERSTLLTPASLDPFFDLQHLQKRSTLMTSDLDLAHLEKRSTLKRK